MGPREEAVAPRQAQAGVFCHVVLNKWDCNRPVGGDGAIAAATARAGRLAPFSSEAVGPLGALAACRDRDAVERRLGDARGLPGLRTPRASAEGTLAGRPLVVFVALVPAAAQADARGRPRRGPRARGPPRRGGGDRAPRAGGPPPPRVRGHREAARHLRQAGLRVADHVITLREFRVPTSRGSPTWRTARLGCRRARRGRPTPRACRPRSARRRCRAARGRGSPRGHRRCRRRWRPRATRGARRATTRQSPAGPRRPRASSIGRSAPSVR